MILQAAGRGHHNLRALFQPVNLLLHIRTAVHGNNADLGVKVRQILQIPRDLLRQLARGSHYNGLRIFLGLIQL